MAEERRLQTYQKPQQQPQGQALDLHTLRHDLTTPTTDDMYSVNKKARPGVRVARALALKSLISHEIIACTKNDEQAISHVRGWIGSKESPDMQVESIVIERFADDLRKAIFDAIDNGMYIPTGRRDNYGRLEAKKGIPEFDIGPDGFPVLTDKWAQFQLMKNHLNKIGFAERSTKGKAERNVIFTLLGHDDEGINTELGEYAATVEKTPEQDELGACRNRIRTLLLKAHEGNKDTARETFVGIAKALNINVSMPADLTKAEDAKLILDEIIKQTQQSRSVVEVEVEVMDDVNGPITAEEEAGFSHDQ